MAHSPYTDKAVRFVFANPGCSKWDLASHLARRCNPSKLYRLVNTQIRLGNLTYTFEGGRYSLYVNDEIEASLRREREVQEARRLQRQAAAVAATVAPELGALEAGPLQEVDRAALRDACREAGRDELASRI